MMRFEASCEYAECARGGEYGVDGAGEGSHGKQATSSWLQMGLSIHCVIDIIDVTIACPATYHMTRTHTVLVQRNGGTGAQDTE